MGAFWGDAALKQELARGGIEEDFAGGRGTETAGKLSVGVGENPIGVVQPNSRHKREPGAAEL